MAPVLSLSFEATLIALSVMRLLSCLQDDSLASIDHLSEAFLPVVNIPDLGGKMKVRWTLTEEEFDAGMDEGYWVEKMRPYLGQVGEQREEDGLVEFGDSIYRIPECHLQAV